MVAAGAIALSLGVVQAPAAPVHAAPPVLTAEPQTTTNNTAKADQDSPTANLQEALSEAEKEPVCKDKKMSSREQKDCRAGYASAYAAALSKLSTSATKECTADNGYKSSESIKACKKGYAKGEDVGKAKADKEKGAEEAGSDCEARGGVPVSSALGRACIGGKSQNPILDLLEVIIRYLVGLIGIVVVLMIVIAGLQYVISGGSPDAVKSAKNRIIRALTGLLLFLLMWGILLVILPTKPWS